MHAIGEIIRKAVTVYAVTLSVLLAAWTGFYLFTHYPKKPSDGSELNGPLPAELVEQIEAHLAGGAL